MRHGDRRGARDAGLQRLSKLTWRATVLSSVGVVGLMNLFNSSAASTTAASAPPPPHPGRLARRHVRVTRPARYA